MQTQKSKSNGGKMTTAQAKALLEAEEQSLLAACRVEIERVLEKHNCVLGAVPTVVPSPTGGFMLGANVMIQPKAAQKE
jgi:hypothetical protein